MSELQPADLKHSELSMVTCNPLTYQVCDFVYDNSPSTSFLDTAELFYETRAGQWILDIFLNFAHLCLQCKDTIIFLFTAILTLPKVMKTP